MTTDLLVFEPFEAAMLSTLKTAYGAVVGVYQGDLHHALKQLPDAAPLRKVLEAIENESIVREREREELRKTAEDAIVAGAAAVGFALLLRRSFTEVRARELELASRTAGIAQYYSNKYFRHSVTPRIDAQIQKALAVGQTTGGSRIVTPEDAFADLTAKIEGIITDDNYWSLTANQAASRATHYGMLKGAKSRGFRGYRLVATLDERTSSVCRGLHGKEFWIDSGIAHYDRVLRASEAQIKDVHPWVVSFDQIRGKTSAELQKMGIMCPPFHANCRTILEAIA